jgi:hypothetical protein
MSFENWQAGFPSPPVRYFHATVGFISTWGGIPEEGLGIGRTFGKAPLLGILPYFVLAWERGRGGRRLLQ